MEKKFKLFSGTNTRYLAEKVENESIKLNKSKFETFSDGEFLPTLEESVRDYNVFIIQSIFAPCSNLMELLLMCDAAKRADAKHIIAIIPYMGWARQDRKDKARTPISMKIVAGMLEFSGIQKIITFDLHSSQSQGFFEIPINHLSANYIFIPYLKKLKLDNLLIASPDEGGTKRAKKFSDHIGCDMVICYKHRSKANNISEFKVIGDVKGKNVILVDDLIDTAGTICTAADVMIDQGALSVRAFATHPVLSGKAYENISKSKIQNIITTDSLPLKNHESLSEIEQLGYDKIITLSLNEMIRGAIKVSNTKNSLSEIFEIK
jgi:ribose-phosphate pyrophosphokinase